MGGFPATRRTWLQSRLQRGDADTHADVLRELMTIYYGPLLAYASASRLATAIDPEELVHGFFSERLAHGSLLAAWNPDTHPLRRYLVNGLWFHARDSLRGARRHDARREDLDLSHAVSDEPEPWRAFCAALANTLVHAAIDHAARCCDDEGLAEHWQAFVRQRYHGETYAAIGAELGQTPGRVAVMARTAAKRFDAALRELLLRDGVPPARLGSAIGELVHYRAS